MQHTVTTVDLDNSLQPDRHVRLHGVGLLPLRVKHDERHFQSIGLKRFQVRRRDPCVQQCNLPRALAARLNIQAQFMSVQPPTECPRSDAYDSPPSLDVLHQRLPDPELSSLPRDIRQIPARSIHDELSVP